MPTDEALGMARDAGLDLVEVSPNERPPVCKIMDYGKHKYLQSKRSKQKGHENKIKEVRMRPKTDPHDKGIKMKRARSFLEEGHRVQFTMRFRGRERFHREIGKEAFDEIATTLEDIAKIERPASMLGQRMTMVLVPIKQVTHGKGGSGAKAVKKDAKPKMKAPAAQAAQVAQETPADSVSPSDQVAPSVPAPQATPESRPPSVPQGQAATG